MTMKDYAELLKGVMQMQIGYKEEELQNASHDREDYLEGIIAGLYIAIEKIDASMFLAEKYS